MDPPNKPSLVMIHGLIGSPDYFDPRDRFLSDRWRNAAHTGT